MEVSKADSLMDAVTLDILFDLEYFFDLSPDLLCIAGYDGYFKKINPAVSKTLGYSYEELFARPINSFIHPDDRVLTAKNRRLITEDHPLLNFENRYITKSGKTVWLSWTSMPIKRDNMVFAIAKIIIAKNKIEEYWRIWNILSADLQNRRSPNDLAPTHEVKISKIADPILPAYNKILPADEAWLNDITAAIKKHIGKLELTNNLISNELFISEKQLCRRVKSLLGITPNKLIQIIRFKLALDAIATGKYSTVAEISNIAGFGTPAYFNKLFKQTYGINVLEVLNKGFQAGSIV